MFSFKRERKLVKLVSTEKAMPTALSSVFLIARGWWTLASQVKHAWSRCLKRSYCRGGCVSADMENIQWEFRIRTRTIGISCSCKKPKCAIVVAIYLVHCIHYLLILVYTVYISTLTTAPWNGRPPCMYLAFNWTSGCISTSSWYFIMLLS